MVAKLRRTSEASDAGSRTGVRNWKPPRTIRSTPTPFYTAVWRRCATCRVCWTGSLEDRKEFVRAFVGGVSVVPGDARLDVQMGTLPAWRDANSTCGLVAGARYVPLQVKLQPEKRYVVASGARRLAA